MAIKESMMVRHMKDDKHLNHIINPEPSLSNNYKNKQNINSMYIYSLLARSSNSPFHTLMQQQGLTQCHNQVNDSFHAGPIWQHCHDVTTMKPIHFILAPRGNMAIIH